MKSRRISLAIVIAVVPFLVFAYVLAPLMKSSTAAPAPAENTLFKGEIVVVILKDKYTLPLEHAQVRKLGNHFFLVGKGNDEGGPASWTNGRMTWVPLDRISEIVEFKDIKEMKKVWEEYSKKDAPGTPPREPR